MPLNKLKELVTPVVLVDTDGVVYNGNGGGTAGTPAGGVQSVQGFGYRGTSTVTRAANTTPYTAGDVVGGVLTIANVGPANGEIFLTSARLLLNITAVPSGMTSFRLHLYTSSPASAIADNGIFTLGSGDRAAYIGFVDLGTATLVGTGTGTPFTQVDQINKQILMPAGTSLFGYLVTNGAFTPAANSETYDLMQFSVAV